MGNPIVHWELMVNDLAKAKEFYTTVFDWKIEDSPTFPGYALVDPGMDPKGAIMIKPETAPAPGITMYYGVEDIDQILARAVTAGATLLVPPTPIEGMGK